MSGKELIKKKLYPFPIKLILSIIVFVINISVVESWKGLLFMIGFALVFYGWVSCIYAIARRNRRWFLTIILMSIVIVVLGGENVPPIIVYIAEIFFLLMGPVKDGYLLFLLLKSNKKERESNGRKRSSIEILINSINDFNSLSEEANAILEKIDELIGLKGISNSEFMNFYSEYNAIVEKQKEIINNIDFNNFNALRNINSIIEYLSLCCENMQSLREREQIYLERIWKADTAEDDSSSRSSSRSSSTTNTNASSSEFFSGCDTKESLSKRYRDLCKVYHPDMGNGSAEIFNKIQSEYDRLKARM